MSVIYEIQKSNIDIFIKYFLCSCSSNNIDLKDDFISYFDKKLDEGIFVTSIGTEFVIGNLEKENVSNNPKVIFSVYVNGNSLDLNNKTYQWLQLSSNNRKKIL